jgi:hypothetical protein
MVCNVNLVISQASPRRRRGSRLMPVGRGRAAHPAHPSLDPGLRRGDVRGLRGFMTSAEPSKYAESEFSSDARSSSLKPQVSSLEDPSPARFNKGLQPLLARSDDRLQSVDFPNPARMGGSEHHEPKVEAEFIVGSGPKIRARSESSSDDGASGKSYTEIRTSKRDSRVTCKPN